MVGVVVASYLLVSATPGTRCSRGVTAATRLDRARTASTSAAAHALYASATAHTHTP